jgi:hypothetical protein
MTIKRTWKSTMNLKSAGLIGRCSAPLISARLWNSFVLPVCTYGCEVWTPSQISLQSIERARKCAARSSLGVNQRTPTSAIYGDLGWFYLQHIIIQRRINWLYQLANSTNSNKLSTLIAKDSLSINKTKWALKTNSMLQQLQLQNPFQIDNNNNNLKDWKKQANLKLQNLAIQYIRNRDSQHQRLLHRKDVPISNKPSEYLQLLTPTQAKRMARLRTGIEPRVCRKCSASTIGTLHSIIECKDLQQHWDQATQKLFSSISSPLATNQVIHLRIGNPPRLWTRPERAEAIEWASKSTSTLF